MWSAMLWITSIYHNKNMITNKRNIVTATIGVFFLVSRNDVVNPHFCTSESSERNFGNQKLEKREATNLEMAELEEKAWWHTKAVYKEGFKIYHSEQKGYHSTATSFVNHSKDATTTKQFGVNQGEEIDYIGTATATTIWKLLRPIILACNKNVSSVLKIFSVDEVEMSPFLRHFESPSALLKVYIDYSPRTFKYSMDFIGNIGFNPQHESC